MKPKKIRDLGRPIWARELSLAQLKYLEFKNLLMNSLDIERLDGNAMDYAEGVFLKDTLIENSQAGYDKTTGKFAMVFGEGINEYGNPTILTFRYYNGLTYRKVASYENVPDGGYIIDALPDTYSLSSDLRRTADILAQCEISIRQNLLACRNPKYVVTRDKDMELSVRQAIQQQQEGLPVIIVSQDLAGGMDGLDLKTEFLVPQIAEYRDLERNKLLNKLGVMTANVAKKERVQSAEVESTIGESVDYLNLLIDTFNDQTEKYGIPYRMKANSSIVDIYNDRYQMNEGETDDKLPNDTI